MEREARGRIFQGTTFDVVELASHAVEKLIGWTEEPDRDDRPEMIALRAKGHPYWYRFFWEAGWCFWEECSEAGSSCDYEDHREIDYTEELAITGCVIESVTCARRKNQSHELWITLSAGGKIVLCHVDSRDIDSPMEFLYEPRATR